ncbi:holotricin-3-like [Penaeus monodon]|uniref:holotricin-3-like n=1 Tax=Penaeus monodon TaxID=6687 RepID=UPI0018A7B0AC|nr:holotricin-3-like [Penaeus monodon]XP_037796922.1 holotricin-3-like [Penaeus monodon]
MKLLSLFLVMMVILSGLISWASAIPHPDPEADFGRFHGGGGGHGFHRGHGHGIGRIHGQGFARGHSRGFGARHG